MTPNERFARLAGICWHENEPTYLGRCKHCGAKISWTPKYVNPELALLRALAHQEGVEVK